MSLLNSDPALQLETHPYFKFSGLDTKLDPTSMDVGEDQPLVGLHNAFCDKNGQITLDNGAYKTLDASNVVHLRHYDFNTLCWAERMDGGTRLKSSRGDATDFLFVRPAILTSTIFNRKVGFYAYASVPREFDGMTWREFPSPSMRALGPAFGVSISRRLVLAGCVGDETSLYISRVDNHAIFPTEEDPKSTSVLKAGKIDIANLLGTADIITGLATFEQNRLLVFTHDRTFIYVTSPGIEDWGLDDRANVNVGCVSHNSITNAGNDVLFCSRFGVHSIRRSAENGIMVYSYPMSEDVESLYRTLFDSVTTPQDISAVWDQDEGQYHIFFPQPDNLRTLRLSMTMPVNEASVPPSWNTGDFLFARCADALGGQLMFGTTSGIFKAKRFTRALNNETQIDNRVSYPVAKVTTPILWNGTMTRTKSAYSLLVQATGAGTINIRARNEAGIELFAQRLEISAIDNGSFSTAPLTDSYEMRFEVRYRGIQLEFEIDAEQATRLNGFAIMTRKE